MMDVRPIDANALKDRLPTFAGVIDEQPTIEPEVRHGRWIRKGCLKKPEYDRTTDLNAYAHRCSACDQVSYFPIDFKDAYCRRCGADMREDGADNESAK